MKKLLFLFALIIMSCDFIGWTSKQEVDFFETCQNMLKKSPLFSNEKEIFQICDCSINIAKSKFANGIDGIKSLEREKFFASFNNPYYSNCSPFNLE